MADEPYGELSYAIASKYRRHTLEALAEGPQTPSEIATDDVEITHISRALQELRERGVVDLLVDEDTQKGRLYGLTDTGEAVADLAAESGRIDVPAADGGE